MKKIIFLLLLLPFLTLAQDYRPDKVSNTIAEAKGIKRSFEAAQTKIQVITREGGDEEIIEAARYCGFV